MSISAPPATPQASLRQVWLGVFDVTLEHRSDDALLLRSTAELGDYPRTLRSRLEPLEYWAASSPRARVCRTAKAQLCAMLSEVRRIAAALLERELSAEGPMAILSAMTSSTRFSGLASCTPAFPYSLMSSDFGKLREILAHKGVAGRTQSGQKPAFSGRNLCGRRD
jgi:feruloyl-CoA synthase